MGADGDLTREQLEQLAGVFRAEAIEHIKGLAEVFFGLEEGGDPASLPDLLNTAFREAHSLKGSAGTLGFERVATVTHVLEDVLGELRQRSDMINSQTVDTLLFALDVIKRAVDTSLPGDSELTDEETSVMAGLSALSERASRPPVAGPSSQPVSPPPALEAKVVVAADMPPEGERLLAPIETAEIRDQFIRIQESKLDSVVNKVGELFEANIQVESTGHDLRENLRHASTLADEMSVLQREVADTPYELGVAQIADSARSLYIELRASSKKLDQDERILAKLIHSSREGLRKIRLAPISTLYVSVKRQVREISRVTGKPIALGLDGGQYQVDRKVLEAIEDPLMHILRNAVDHGIESKEVRKAHEKPEQGRLNVSVRHTGGSVELTIADDGGGIDPERIRRSAVEKGLQSEQQAADLSIDQLFDFLFHPGFSTQQDVSQLSGRGFGLDVVKYTVERLGGEVRISSEVGQGTAITMRLPLAMSTMRCMIVRVAGRGMAIPTANIEKVIIPEKEECRIVGGGPVIVYDSINVPYRPLGDLLNLMAPSSLLEHTIGLTAILTFGQRRFAFGIDEIIEYAQVILKPLDNLLERLPIIAGTSLLGTGELALVLNPGDLVRMAGGVSSGRTQFIFDALEKVSDMPTILVTDDSIATRTLEKSLLEAAGYKVLTASDGYKALEVLSNRHVDLVLSDVQMPNMDGIDLAQTIKNRPNLNHLPVILVSALGSDEDKARGLAAGADAYIVKKNLTQNELVETITRLL